MYWLQQKDNLKKAEQYGFSKEHLKCKDIGHVWIPQLDTQTWDKHYLCFNCGTDDKSQMKHIYKLPPTIPYRLFYAYGAIG